MAGLLSTGCTTSRAVLAWQAGREAEARGDTPRAILRYEEAFLRDGGLVGAELDRIRLLRQQPDKREAVREAVAELVDKKGADPAVAAFTAMLALADGDPTLARQRLETARTLKPTDLPEIATVLRAARVAVLAAEGRWQAADEALGGDPDVLGVVPPLLAATLAWNLGRDDQARRALERAPESTRRRLLEALLAREAGDWKAVVAAVQGLEADDRTPTALALGAEAWLRLGEPGRGVELATEAARQAPADPWVAEVQAVALIASGSVELARDLLAGLTARGAGWTAWHHLGIANVRLGDLEGAARAFGQAAQRCPDCAAPAKNRDVLAGWGVR